MLIGFVVAGWQIIAIYTLLLPFARGFSGGTATQTLVSRWFVRRRGLAFSIWAMGLVLAGVLLLPIVVWMKALVGWRDLVDIRCDHPCRGCGHHPAGLA